MPEIAGVESGLSGPQRVSAVGFLRRNHQRSIPESAGVYAFWWVADKKELLDARKRIRLKGPGGRVIDVDYADWWPEHLFYPCLYVGKTTNLRSRFARHIRSKSPGRCHGFNEDGSKVKPVTTTCQLRFGIEHVFHRDQRPLQTIDEKVGYSWFDMPHEDDVAERFFFENRLIGSWKPWFNVDTER